jgi:hypothetical protein
LVSASGRSGLLSHSRSTRRQDKGGSLIRWVCCNAARCVEEAPCVAEIDDTIPGRSTAVVTALSTGSALCLTAGAELRTGLRPAQALRAGIRSARGGIGGMLGAHFPGVSLFFRLVARERKRGDARRCRDRVGRDAGAGVMPRWAGWTGYRALGEKT